MKEFFLFLLVFLFVFWACSKKITPVEKEKPSLTESEKIDSLAKVTFQKDYQIDYNLSKSVVCITKSIKKRPNDIFPTLSLILYDLSTNKILFQEKIPKATGNWINDAQFEVITIPGRVGRAASLNQKQGFIFDVKKHIKTKK